MPQTLLLHLQLEYEPEVYKTLAGSVSVPFIRWFGTKCDYNAMVLTLESSWPLSQRPFQPLQPQVWPQNGSPPH